MPAINFCQTLSPTGILRLIRAGHPATGGMLEALVHVQACDVARGCAEGCGRASGGGERAKERAKESLDGREKWGATKSAGGGLQHKIVVWLANVQLVNLH